MIETTGAVEKRSGARRHLIFYLRIFDEVSGQVLGHLLDISPEGIMLLCDGPVMVNTEYRLRMRLPENVSGSNELTFKAVSRWCQQDDSPDFYLIGFEIQDLGGETRKFVKSLIEEFGLQD